ncbi:MAG: HEAT repeat domain-containing protein [Gemmataceae bacterium]|nr:HEAT repeat domain-containing protein [Gemmataceae bacterium]
MKNLVIFSLIVSFLTVHYVGELTAQAPSKADVPKFMELLKDKEAKKRVEGVNGIAAIGKLKASYAADAVKPLMEMVKKDSDAKVRAASAIALGSIDPEDATVVDLLIEVLKEDKDKDVRSGAAQGLGQLGSRAKKALPALKEAAAKAKEDQDKKMTKIVGAATKAIQAK